MNRLSEQEEDDDDDGDYDDIEEGCEDELLDNVSKNTATTSSEYKCHTGPGDSKFNAYSCTTDTITPHMSHSLRKRCTASASAKVKTNKSKCVQFIRLPKRSDDDSPPPSESNEHHSKPLKKIIFNGTFPIDDPYSSRFEEHSNLNFHNQGNRF